MKTLAQLKAFCEKNNIKHDLIPDYNGEYYDFTTGKFEKIQVGWYFGMNNIAGRSGKSEWQWTWFKTYQIDLTDDAAFFFEERYSTLNGRSYKGISEASKAIETIDRRMA